MMIQSPANSYFVTLKIDENSMAAKLNDSFVFINILREQKIICDAIEYFSTIKNNEFFSDFYEYFLFEGNLYVVFKKCGEASFSVGDKSFYEKHLIVRSLLSKMVDVPFEISCDILEAEKIILGEDLSVSFVYDLSISEEYQRECRLKAMAKLGRIIRLVYGNMWHGLLDNFLDCVEFGKFNTFEEVFIAFLDIFGELEISEPVVFEKISLKDRLLTLQKQVIPAVLAVILAGAGVFALCYSIYISIVPNDVNTEKITEIGTVKINE